MIWGKSPERRVVMPAGAFEFLKKDFRQNFIKKVGIIDERTLKKSKNITRERQARPQALQKSLNSADLELSTGAPWSNLIEKVSVLDERSLKK